MLSKSQARAFFLGFTLLFSGVFLFLTVDTIRQVPARSHEDRLTPDVVAGKEIWERNNCMGCHTLLGEGAYYAPELTKVVERRGEVWMRTFLKDPQAMYPGRRKMVQYNFDDQQITELIAFFRWVGEIDTNGFPAKPDMTTAGFVAQAAVGSTGKLTAPEGAAAAPGATSAAPAYFDQVCKGCHAVAGAGGVVGPALDGVGGRLDAAALDVWLKDPASVKPGTTMPNLALPDATRAELVAYLTTLR